MPLVSITSVEAQYSVDTTVHCSRAQKRGKKMSYTKHVIRKIVIPGARLIPDYAPFLTSSITLTYHQHLISNQTSARSCAVSVQQIVPMPSEISNRAMLSMRVPVRGKSQLLLKDRWWVENNELKS